MKVSLQNTISVVSFLFLIIVSSCNSPETYARKWCDLNSRIKNSSGEEMEKLKEEAANLEEKVFQKYANDKKSMDKVIELTNACK